MAVVAVLIVVAIVLVVLVIVAVAVVLEHVVVLKHFKTLSCEMHIFCTKMVTNNLSFTRWESGSYFRELKLKKSFNCYQCLASRLIREYGYSK